MSIYSGFPTRQMQTLYNQLLLGLIDLLQQRLTKFYAQQSCDQVAFAGALAATLKRIQHLEQNKHLQPKFSTAVVGLAQKLNIKKSSRIIDQREQIAPLNINASPVAQNSIPKSNLVYVSHPVDRRISRRGESAPRERRVFHQNAVRRHNDLRVRINQTEEEILSRMVNQYRKRSRRQRKERSRQRHSQIFEGSKLCPL